MAKKKLPSEDDVYQAAIDALQKATGPIKEAMKCAQESPFNNENEKIAWRDVLTGHEIMIRNAERAYRGDSNMA